MLAVDPGEEPAGEVFEFAPLVPEVTPEGVGKRWVGGARHNEREAPQGDDEQQACRGRVRQQPVGIVDRQPLPALAQGNHVEADREQQHADDEQAEGRVGRSGGGRVHRQRDPRWQRSHQHVAHTVHAPCANKPLRPRDVGNQQQKDGVVAARSTVETHLCPEPHSSGELARPESKIHDRLDRRWEAGG